ncbi:MAG TPA: hypothetical protein VGB89_12660 [Bacteroidota bacterium]
MTTERQVLDALNQMQQKLSGAKLFFSLRPTFETGALQSVKVEISLRRHEIQRFEEMLQASKESD